MTRADRFDDVAPGATPAEGRPPAWEGLEGWRRYRCPVCGHTDGVVLDAVGTHPIDCSHCDTPLEVRLTSATSERVTVQVSRDLPRA